MHWFDNAPNPFRPATEISFNLPEPSYGSLVINHTMACVVDRQLDEHMEAGVHHVSWTAADHPSGIFIDSTQVH